MATPQGAGRATWYSPAWSFPTSGFTTFTFDSGWGIIDHNSTVKAAVTQGSSALTVLFTGTSYQLEPVGRGQMVVWNAWDDWSKQTRAHIRSWTQTRGTQILVGGVPDYDVVHVALSDTKIVWMGATDVGAVQGNYGSAALYWSPLSTSPSEIQRHTGTGPLPSTHQATERIVTHGDLAATTVGAKTDGGSTAHIVVANLITGQVWEIPSRPNNLWHDVLAMNADSLLVQETAYNANHEVLRLVRLDLRELDALVTGLH
jgi:hypothetical protein